MRAILALEDGTIFPGESFGAEGEKFGEVVFNTGMTGYQEVLTDPSYKGQMVVMTYPHIGNYGINPQDFESWKPHVEAFVVRDLCQEPSNWRSEESLNHFLKRYGIMGVTGIDTRALTRHIRLRGSMKGVLSTSDLDESSLVKKAQDAPDISEIPLVEQVSTKEVFHWTETTPAEWVPTADGFAPAVLPRPRHPYRVVALDYGIKYNTIRRLVDVGCDVWVMPCSSTLKDILALEPEGIFLSNGPGDPRSLIGIVETVRSLMGIRPIFGICLGHQLLGLAAGGRIFKLKFGHHGCNQPTKIMATGAVEITSQNHNYAIDPQTLDFSNMIVTHTNLNDATVEGMQDKSKSIFSVQFHPEASPGPHDSSLTFRPFVEMMEALR